ncbi:hypothetical protein [Nitrosococcus oceani]|uniref:hypothetical protein n=1 Tax=Nitrosococcus oceani TaxID=1229 RepID=UPI0034D25FC8
MFGLPYRLFISGMGLLIALLAVTGLLIWLKKRRAGKSRPRRRRPLAAETGESGERLHSP